VVDVTDDSSKVVSNLLAAHQKAMLDLTFLEDADNRDKFNCIIAEAIHPKMPADNYMDKEENENEIKQVETGNHLSPALVPNNAPHVIHHMFVHKASSLLE